MKENTKYMVITIILIFISLGIGIWIGIYLGYRTGASTVATISINTQVHDLENRVEALKAQRNQYSTLAIEIIEHGLDKDILSLLPEYREDLDIPMHTLDFIKKGLQTAKRYRTSFPRTSQGKLMDKDVKRALSTVN